MSFYNLFGSDADLEAGQGVVLDYGDAGKITIHRAGGANKRYGQVMEAKFKRVRRQLETGSLANDVANRLMAEAYAEAVITGWEGVTDRKGKPLEYNQENVVRLLLDLPDLFSDIQAQATKISNFRKADLSDDLGN